MYTIPSAEGELIYCSQGKDGALADRAATSQDMTPGELEGAVTKTNLRSKFVVPIVRLVDQPAVGVARNLKDFDSFVAGGACQ